MADIPQIQLGAYQLGQGPTSEVAGTITIGAPALAGTGQVSSVEIVVGGGVSPPMVVLPRRPQPITGDVAWMTRAPRVRAAGTVIPVITGVGRVIARPARVVAEGRVAPPITGIADLTVRTPVLVAQGLWIRRTVFGVGSVAVAVPRAVSAAQVVTPAPVMVAPSAPGIRRRVTRVVPVDADLRRQIAAEDDALLLALEQDWTKAA